MLAFKYNICDADFEDMQLINKFNEVFRVLLRVIDIVIFSKYAWVVLLKDKKVYLLLMHFQTFLNNPTENQIRYRQTNAVNFIAVPLKIAGRQ